MPDQNDKDPNLLKSILGTLEAIREEIHLHHSSILTSTEAAREMKMSHEDFLQRVFPEIPHKKVGEKFLFTRDSLLRFIEGVPKGNPSNEQVQKLVHEGKQAFQRIVEKVEKYASEVEAHPKVFNQGEAEKRLAEWNKEQALKEFIDKHPHSPPIPNPTKGEISPKNLLNPSFVKKFLKGESTQELKDLAKAGWDILPRTAGEFQGQGKVLMLFDDPKRVAGMLEDAFHLLTRIYPGTKIFWAIPLFEKAEWESADCDPLIQKISNAGFQCEVFFCLP